MELVYATLLLHKLGKPIDEANIRKVMEAAGAEADESKIKSLVASLKGVDIEKALEEAAVTPMPAPTAEKKEEKPEEKEEERKEMAAEGLSALFG